MVYGEYFFKIKIMGLQKICLLKIKITGLSLELPDSIVVSSNNHGSPFLLLIMFSGRTVTQFSPVVLKLEFTLTNLTLSTNIC